MSWFPALAGTVETAFSIGRLIKATLSTSSLTASRTFTLPDASGTLSLKPVKQTITDGPTITLAWLHASLNCVTLGGNRTLAISGTPVAGERCTLRIEQDGTGARTITWPTSGVTINWPRGEEPILTTTANRVDAIELICFDGTSGALVFDAYPLPMNVY